MADVPRGTEVKPGQRIDPLIHYAGRVNVHFVNEPGSVKRRLDVPPKEIQLVT